MAGQQSHKSDVPRHEDTAALLSVSGNLPSRSSHRDSLTIQRPPSSPRLGAGRSGSLAENLRNIPMSPRAHRTSSVSSAAVQDLLNNPPAETQVDLAFAGRDWRSIRVEEIIEKEKVRFVTLNDSVEKATETLVSSGSPNVVLLAESPESRIATGTFDYNDLNAYLLLVVGLARPEGSQLSHFKDVANKGREGKPIPMKDIRNLGAKEPMITLAKSSPLSKAMEIFGSGIHRILISQDESAEVIGVLTQLRLVQFFWQNGRQFTNIDPLFHKTLRDLDVGSQHVISINGDKPLTEALEIIHHEGITSLPVLDHARNVIGNISHVDVKLLTKSSATDLLRGSCLHFISVILSERGVDDGKDSYPVFYVNDFSTLAHTVAKLVATRSHRMWVVDSPSPASSGPPTPAIQPAHLTTQVSILNSSSTSTAPSSAIPTSSHQAPTTTSGPLSSSHHSFPHIAPTSSAAASTSSGRLAGVVSLTDILNLFARASGLHPLDPAQVRRARRRSSSSSVRQSLESSRSESISSTTEDISRSGSVSGRRQ